LPLTEKNQERRRFLDPHFVSKLERLDLKARLVVEGFLTGLHRSPYHGFSVEFAEHRQYMPGDPLRHLDWKVLAKSDRMYLKQYEEETNLRGSLLVDTSASMGYGSHGITKLDYARMLAAALAYLMLTQNDAVGAYAFAAGRGEHIPARSTMGHLRTLLLLFDRLAPAGGTDFAASLHSLAERITRRGLVVILSDLLDEPDRIAQAIHHFRHRKHEVLVFHILDPMEVSFDFQREAVYVDLESGERISTRPRELRTDYRRRVSDWREQLRQACIEKRADYVPLTTDQPYDRALLEYLSKRARLL